VLGEAGEQVRNFGVGVIWSAIVLIVFNLAIRGAVWVLDALAERNASRRLFYKRLVPIVRIVLWIFAAYLIVRVIFQVDYQALIAAAAAVGVAVGFAAQDLLKNLFGGIILVFDQPFQVGDKITVGGTYGEVVSIGLRSTRMVTPDDNLVSVPNAAVVDHQVANANAGELNCQVVTDLYLPGWVDEALAKRIAFDAAASSKYAYLNKPVVVLVSDVFKETFLTRVRVKAYVMDPRLEFLFQSDVTERARAGFRAAGLLKPEHFRQGLVERSAAGAMSSFDHDRDVDD
jgi:small-conductance mechanosensitive channel